MKAKISEEAIKLQLDNKINNSIASLVNSKQNTQKQSPNESRVVSESQ